MVCFVVAQLNIHDPEGYEKYRLAFRKLFPNYDAKILAVDDAPTVVEGEWPYRRFALLEFRDREEAQRWYNSPEYQAASRDLRWPAVSGTILFVEGRVGSAGE